MPEGQACQTLDKMCKHGSLVEGLYWEVGGELGEVADFMDVELSYVYLAMVAYISEHEMHHLREQIWEGEDFPGN